MAWLPDDWDELVRGRHRTEGAPDGARRRSGNQPRRVSTIAAFTTGTLAVSTAAFAATVPSSSDAPTTVDPASPQTTTYEANTLGAALAGDGSGGSGAAASGGSAGGGGLAAAVSNPDPVFTDLTLAADKTTVEPNAPVVLTVKATEAMGGAPLAHQQVKIVVVDGPKWTATTTLTTDDQGNASITARLLSTTTITAVFDGGSTLRPSVADAATITIQQRRTNQGYLDSGIPTVVPGSTIGEKAVYLASLQKGKPYVYGAAGPYSFDCSGLVQYVFKQLGRSLPRTAEQQYRVSTKVSQAGKQPGDLIFYGKPGGIYHVGIYAGNGYMWAAPQTGGVVSLRPIYSSSYLVGRIM
ncbi:C40 family peptidase [Frankia sp. CNm7]|uniref:C40 family peptidase n=2 Tax=Frankia nepalensis TaxID=1836974 RepID=A0A937RG88_9ACTN|nr:C40 family peptidase [Frankia nepalensis]MBL7502803.1 C40 family peptidase [Frankia nepalensis]MBL7514575.1 C40 family peptidase [Frankia nepalensis]MBL7519057.1 C40 family peptidase [Frankia nepalensis]MBL7629840.1 C40 family peptidase [Frankia nepalensis]